MFWNVIKRGFRRIVRVIFEGNVMLTLSDSSSKYHLIRIFTGQREYISISWRFVYTGLKT